MIQICCFKSYTFSFTKTHPLYNKLLYIQSDSEVGLGQLQDLVSMLKSLAWLDLFLCLQWELFLFPACCRG